MKQNKFITSVPVTFEYGYLDAEGASQTETINLTVKRMSFRESVSKDLREMFDKVQDDPAAIAELLEKLIAVWNIEDEAGEMLPITQDLLLSLPADFIAQLSEAVIATLSANPTKQPPTN